MSVNSDAIWSILDNQVKFFFNRDCDADVYAEFEGPRQVICFEPIDGRLFQSFLRRSYRAETDGEICTNFDIYVQAACDDALWDETLNRVGGMFEALSQAMVILPTLQANNLHRMADAHLEMVAIAMALGIDPADFDRIFWNNVDHLKTANTASDPFVEAMIDYLQHRRNNDTQKVSKVLDAMKLDFTNRSCGSYLAALPKNASALSRKLSTVQNALYEAGYTLHFDTKSDGTDLTIKQIAPSRLNKKQKEAAKRRAALIANGDVASNNDSDSDTTTED